MIAIWIVDKWKDLGVEFGNEIGDVFLIEAFDCLLDNATPETIKMGDEMEAEKV